MTFLPGCYKDWIVLSNGFTIQWISIRETNCVKNCIKIYPQDGAIHHLGNWGLVTGYWLVVTTFQLLYRWPARSGGSKGFIVTNILHTVICCPIYDKRNLKIQRQRQQQKMPFKKWMCIFSIFILTIQTHLLCQIYVDSPWIEFLRTISKSRKRKKFSLSLVFAIRNLKFS